MGTTHVTYPIHLFGTSPERIYRALTDRSDLDAYLDGTESKMYTACAAVWPIIVSALKTWVESDKAKNR